MSSERWQQLEEIFEQALDKPASERETFLQEACGDDTGLRRAVDGLLEADREGMAFLEKPLVPTPAPASGSSSSSSSSSAAKPPLTPVSGPRGPLPSGGQLGAYRLLREVGRGGMSTVYLATRDDRAFQRRVAIKIIRQGMESEDALRRLRIERQILASLDHPYIAKLYDGGTTEEGLPYFVMEYVQGQPIDVYCDQRQLTLDERTALFRRVCEAVHYAHQNLIVHRDLKPSNILVTVDGTPKLLDFGIAKLLNPELSSSEVEPTATWMRLLTPQYASPEQVRGEAITTVSDVYSLGVLLYQLLTGLLPYQVGGRTPQQVERLLTDFEPPKPSTAVLRTVAEEISKEERSSDPATRDAAAARGVRRKALARQLDGDLDNIVLMAMRSSPQRRYSSVEQLSEDLARYRRGYPVLARPGSVRYRVGKFVRRNRITLGVAATVVLLLLAFGVATILQAGRVRRERDQARQERDQKQQVLALVEEIFRLADPGESGGETFTVRQALDRSSASLDRRLEKQPAVEAALRNTIGRIYLNLGLLDEAEAHFTEVLEIRRRLHGDDSVEVADAQSSIGEVLRDRGRYQQAEAVLRGAVETARQKSDLEPAALVGPLNQLVTLMCYRGEYDAADGPSAEALELARTHLDPSRSELAVAITNRANVLRKRGDLERSDALYREGLELEKALFGEDHPEVANILNNLGVIANARGDHAEAERLHRENLALRRKLYGGGHPSVAQSLNNLAAVAQARGDLAAAEAHYREAVTLLRTTLGASHPLTVKVAMSLAGVLLDSAQPEQAERWLREQLIAWQSDAVSPETLAWAENTLGTALAAQRRFDEAEALLLESTSRLEQHYPEGHPQVDQARARIASLYEAQGRTREAARYRERHSASS